jgi:GNAT superfamily N-acetyltransferase
MDYLRRFYDISAAAGVPIAEPFEVWAPCLREAMLQAKADLWPIGAHGQMIGGVLFMADTMHVAVLPEWQGRWISKALRRAYDTWTHDIPIRAIVQPDNRKVIELATRLGFTFQREDGPHHIYVKEPQHAHA